MSITVSSTQKIEIIGNKYGYYGWLVIPKLKKWIDFNTLNSKNYNYKLTRVDDNKVNTSDLGKFVAKIQAGFVIDGKRTNYSCMCLITTSSLTNNATDIGINKMFKSLQSTQKI